jgi:hypothetical protein
MGEILAINLKDDSRKKFDQETFGIYTAMGDVRQGLNITKGFFHESSASIGSVMGQFSGKFTFNQKERTMLGC